jgi:putative nucleotidyltransferase with HDIG domain
MERTVIDRLTRPVWMAEPPWVGRLLPIVAIAVAAALFPVLLLAVTAGHHVMVAPVTHVVVVGVAGALAAVAAMAMSVMAARVNDGRAVLLGMAFSVMATMLVVHAVATPGAWLGQNGLMQLAGALNVPAGATILAASAVPSLRRPRGARRLLWVQVSLVAALVLAGALALANAATIPAVPRPASDAARLVFAVSAGVLALLAWRAGRTYVLTRRGSDLLVTVGLVWLSAGQYGLLNNGMMDAAWWAAHALEVAGVGLVGLPAALDIRHGVASRPLMGDLRPVTLVADEEAFLGGHVRALMVSLAEKDPSTEHHTRRVATLAVEIGEELGLAERRLRLLALGGLLHDMGKLAIPDHILNKPGRLTEEESAVIRRHPALGRELLTELGGFAPLVLRLVESHHERLDAHGYPHRRSAQDLELEVRILTVADVYDALTDDRVYRPAWSPSSALELLDRETGSAVDRRCVTALQAVLSRTCPPRHPRGGETPSHRGAARARMSVRDAGKDSTPPDPAVRRVSMERLQAEVARLIAEGEAALERLRREREQADSSEGARDPDEDR